MAKISANLFNTSGKLGDYVTRTRDGKTQIYVLKKSMKPRSEKVKTINQNFTICSRFGSAIIKTRILNTAWKNSQIEGKMANARIMRINNKKLKPGYDISELFLVPDEEKFETGINLVSFNDKQMKVSTGIYPGKIIGTKRLSLQGVLQLTDPKDKNFKEYMFLPVHTSDKDFKNETPVEFEITFLSNHSELIKEYNRKNLLLNLSIKDTQGEAEKFSREVYINV
jgi:hypothetical protein